VPRKRKMLKKKLSLIKRTRTERSMRLNWRPRKLRRRRRGKSRDSGSSRRRQLIDKQKLMHSEPREPSRRARDRQESVKDLSTRRDSA